MDKSRQAGPEILRIEAKRKKKTSTQESAVETGPSERRAQGRTWPSLAAVRTSFSTLSSTEQLCWR